MTDEADPVTLFYGDDHGEIDIEVLGARNGTTTRQMQIPRRLARDLYEDLEERLETPTEKWLVYSTNGFHINNVAIVDASSEEEAIEIAADTDVSLQAGSSYAKKIEDTPEHGDAWAAKR